MHANVHELRPSITVSQGVAQLARLDAEGYWVELAGRELFARRAFGCLVAPIVGDQVWLAGDDEHGYFVIAVLVRARAGATRVEVEGEFELCASGPVRLRGEAGVELSTPTTLAMRSQVVELEAQSGMLSVTELRAVASRVVASLARVTRIGELLELLVETVTQRSENSFRVIEGVDHTQATTVQQRISQDLHIDSRRALINGGELVKMDGDQIHLG